MSKRSIKFAMEEERFNLKTIGVVMFLIDLFLLPYLIPKLLIVFWWLIVYEISMIFSFLIGLRGQGKFKEVMLNLKSIASNKELSIDERETQLVQGIHHHCLELGYLYDQRNKIYGLHLFNKTKNLIESKKIKKKRIVIKKKGGDK